MLNENINYIYILNRQMFRMHQFLPNLIVLMTVVDHYHNLIYKFVLDHRIELHHAISK